ncbi:MAG: PD-(D/E)XK nuclease family protein [Breznakibacter sp.]
MNDQFLSALARYYIQKYGTAVSDLCFVFPSRRAGIFFRNHLANLSGTPIWSPHILTINEFTETIDQTPVADNITLLFKLYEVYAGANEQPLTFDDFLPWGEMLLADFDDIDKYLVDARQLFSNLMSLKELEGDFTFLDEEQVKAIRTFWASFNPHKLSEHQRNFLKNWATLYPVYTRFGELLAAERIAYTGMTMRRISARIAARDMEELPWGRVVFAGFFVLTPSERDLFRYLKNQGKADFFWDYSPWMMQRGKLDGLNDMPRLPFRDAASFLLENVTAFPPPFDWELPQGLSYPDIEIIGVASQTEQLRLVGEFLEQVGPEAAPGEDMDKALGTAIVLTDENMLIPALHAIPPQFGKINVTLGYPLKNTPIYGLIGAIVQLQRNAKITRDGKVWFYFRDVLPVIQHQYISAIDNTNALAVKNQMLGKNSIFVEANELCVGNYFPLIFKKITDSDQIPAYIEHIVFSTYNLIRETTQSYFEQEFVYALYKSVVKLRDLLKKLDKDILPDTWLKLFRKLTETQTVPFKGEPLSGLQVMGMMETRAIDFDNLVVLNMNEGVFPKDSAPNTFIPFNLRKGFGLPTLEHQDAIFSYYFFRLIHRAKKLRLVYNSSSQGLQSGEMSRYLYQLIYQHPAKPKLLTAVEQVKLYKMPAVVGYKTREVADKLRNMGTASGKAISPSALSSYLECEMRFFFRYVAGIKETEEISESLDMRVFGILLHDTMEHLYRQFIVDGCPKTLTEHDLDRLSGDDVLISDTIRKVFAEQFSELSLRNDDFLELQGKNILVFEVLKKYVRQIIQNDKSMLPLTLHHVEASFDMPFTLGDGTIIKIGGKVDRIDETGGMVRVVDYKTGSAVNKVAKLDYLFEPKRHKDVKAIFQTLLYASVLKHRAFAGRRIAPAVLQLKNVFSQNDYSVSIGEYKNVQMLELDLVEDEFNDRMRSLLDGLFDTQRPFVQTDEVKKCEMCAYRTLCNR